MQDLIRTLEKWFTQFTSDSAPDIDLTIGDYVSSGRPFKLYVGVAGIIKGIDKTGNPISRNFVAGYHPVSMIRIYQAGTTATDLGACYF